MLAKASRLRELSKRIASNFVHLIRSDAAGKFVSANRKALLLQKFGSVARLRRASVEQIAATEGIGRKLAEGVAAFLAERV